MCHLVEQAQTVDALQANANGKEEVALLHVPSCSQDTVTMIGLEAHGDRTLEFMDDDTSSVVDISHDGIARDGFATLRKGIALLDSLVVKHNDFLSVNGCRSLSSLGRDGSCILFLVLTTESKEASPRA